jgi:hypothetical protein
MINHLEISKLDFPITMMGEWVALPKQEARGINQQGEGLICIFAQNAS